MKLARGDVEQITLNAKWWVPAYRECFNGRVPDSRAHGIIVAVKPSCLLVLQGGATDGKEAG